MPYSTVDELPEAVRKVLTPDAQALFLAALNDAQQDGNPGEPFAMSRAWSAVGRQYQVLSDGSYGAVTKNAMFTDRAPLIMVEHDSILQTLDRESNGVYLGKEYFEPSVDAWNKVPLIYAQEHPDMDAFDKDPEAELKRINGRLIKGQASGTRIELTGHPRLMTAFKLQDKEIEQGIADGKISTSNGFRTRVKDGKLSADVDPHHILFFEEKPDGPVPGDKGVVILNTQSRKAEGLRLTDRLRALFQGAADPPEPTKEDDDMTDKELEAKLADAKKDAADAQVALTQLKADMAKKDQEIATHKAKISELETANATFVKKAADDKWSAFKAKYVPPGMIADADKEKATREAFEKDPLNFLEKLLERKPGETGGEEGLQFTRGGEKKAARVGKYDPSTGKWE